MSGADAFTAFTHGDAVAAEQLRRAFTVIRDHSKDPEVARAARQVLDGRRSVREVVEEPEVAGAMESGMSRFRHEWDGLGDEERRALLAEGERERAETAQWLGIDPRTVAVTSPEEDPVVEDFLTRRPDQRE